MASQKRYFRDPDVQLSQGNQTTQDTTDTPPTPDTPTTPSPAGNQSARYTSALERSQSRYNQMIAEMNAAKEAVGGVPSELTDVAEMYKKGGTYGEGQRALLREELGKGTAAEQAALVSSGMSSGSMAAASRGRYARNLATGYSQIEDERTKQLASALTAVAAAKTERGSRLGAAYTTTAQLIGSYKEPTVSEFASAEEIQQISDIASKERLGMQLTAEEKIAAMGITADMEQELLRITSAEKIAAASEAAAKERLGMQLTSEEKRAKDEIESAKERLSMELTSQERQTSAKLSTERSIASASIKASAAAQASSQAFTAQQNALQRESSERIAKYNLFM